MPLGAGTGGIFPLPAVPMPFRSTSASPRVRQRYFKAAVTASLVNFMVVCLNFMSCSFAQRARFDAACRWFRFSCLSSKSSQTRYIPSSNLFPNSFPLGDQMPFATAPQRRALAHLVSCASRFASRRVAVPSSSSSSASFTAALSDGISGSDRPITSTALWLLADKAALPASAGSADLVSVLPPDVAVKYSSPDALLLPLKDRKPVPHGVMMVTKAEYLKLIRRMAALNMLTFTQSPKAVNGIFGVPKDDNSHRVIIDARPANSYFQAAEVNLPSPELLAKLRPEPGRPVYFGKVDLDNFYHRLRVPEWLQSYFALPPLRAADLGLEAQYGAEALVHPCCATLPMGFSHSVYLAQVAHEHLLNSKVPALSPENRLSASTVDFELRDRLLHQVYIDDLICVSHHRVKVDTAIEGYLPVAEENGTPSKPSKVHRATSKPIELLGLEADGERHELGLSVPKLQVLCTDTLALLDRGRCSGHEMEVLVGRWTWAALVRRPVLATLSSVYRFQEAADRRVFEIWPSVRRELMVLVGLAPLLFVDLDDSFFSCVLASDASSTGMGVCASRPFVRPVAVENIAKEIPARPVVPKKPELPPDAEVEPPLPLPDPLDHARAWRTIVSSRWTRSEHINVLEMRAACTAVRWAMSSPSSTGCRLLLLADSLVCVYGLLKGRSSSPPLLRVLRRLSAHLLSSGLTLVPRWVRSSLNPADGPSRSL